ncbi:MAG TPA: hypothetical protein VNJ04_03615 [Gemmatimonadaceae bacterium]|nr:hypothetical protein [Gemmatimonadaceae bacterium]
MLHDALARGWHGSQFARKSHESGQSVLLGTRLVRLVRHHASFTLRRRKAWPMPAPHGRWNANVREAIVAERDATVC